MPGQWRGVPGYSQPAPIRGSPVGIRAIVSADSDRRQRGIVGLVYLRELCDWVTDEGRAGKLTADAARADLAQHEALLNQSMRWSSARSPEDTDSPEHRTWQVVIKAQALEFRAGHGSEQLLHWAAVVCGGEPHVSNVPFHGSLGRTEISRTDTVRATSIRRHS